MIPSKKSFTRLDGKDKSLGRWEYIAYYDRLNDSG